MQFYKMNIFKDLQVFYKQKPLLVVLLCAALVRFLAAFFSRGFGMHDDHFLVIEAAQAWVDGEIVPGKPYEPGGSVIVDGHSLTYMGFHYLLFRFFTFIHIYDPQVKMLLVRIIHALLSVAVVGMVYKITEKFSNKSSATQAGMLVALLWFFPMLSVRNLVEVFCIPFILLGILLILRTSEDRKHFWYFLLAGFVVGVSISIRFQLLVFVGGIGLVLLIQRRWLQTIFFGMGVVLSILLLQGWVDYLIFGYPFAEFIEYTKYNLEYAYSYIIGPWYNYILLFAGILLPPVSLMLLYGYFKSWRKTLLIFLPSFLFLIFHSLYPNKQERFIFPIIPFIIMGGIVGWNDFVAISKFWLNHKLLLKRIWVAFWIVNFLLLIPVTIAYSKRSRVEAMEYLQRFDVKVILAEDSNKESVQMLPRFYSNQWMYIFNKSKKGFNTYLKTKSYYTPTNAAFIMLFSDENLVSRVDSMKVMFPELKYDTVFLPGLIDNIMHKLNPVNRNETIYLYRNHAIPLREKIN